MELESSEPSHNFVYVDEAGFNLTKCRRRDRNIIGHRATVDLLAAMDAACEDITVDACRGWIRHSKRFFPRCIGREYIQCDVDENMWADRQERLDV